MRKKGFTLVELLVVISIIALLMAILMPALARVRKQAANVICKSNLKQWGSIFYMYTQDHGGRFQPGQKPDGKYDFTVDWVIVMEKYYTDWNLRFCPAAKKPYEEGGTPTFGAWGGTMGGSGVYHGSYGINNWICNIPPTSGTIGGQYPVADFWRNINVKGQNNIPMVVECWWARGFPKDTDTPLTDQKYHELNGAPEKGTGHGPPGNMQRYCIDRHNGYVNGVFMDQSVRTIGLKELWALKWNRSFDVRGYQGKWPEWMSGFKDYNTGR